MALSTLVVGKGEISKSQWYVSLVLSYVIEVGSCDPCLICSCSPFGHVRLNLLVLSLRLQPLQKHRIGLYRPMSSAFLHSEAHFRRLRRLRLLLLPQVLHWLHCTFPCGINFIIFCTHCHWGWIGVCLQLRIQWFLLLVWADGNVRRGELVVESSLSVLSLANKVDLVRMPLHHRMLFFLLSIFLIIFSCSRVLDSFVLILGARRVHA